ncbi:hypothetical protein [Synechococcus sp. MW101C3]|uniref:hypothetical protein n=1 Tax=Synechococcus sp. MW101C3 TaxID=210768 RepID=UPI001181C64D|nr:hypothetical protein [Synechococcus sp. MW101C3]
MGELYRRPISGSALAVQADAMPTANLGTMKVKPHATDPATFKGGKLAMFGLQAIAGLAVISLSDCRPAEAITITINNFTDVYSVSNWTSIPGTGSISTAGAPNSIQLTSGNNGSNSPSQTSFSIVAQGAGNITFRWSFVTSDRDGPLWDPFGYTLNSTFVQLTNNIGPNSQGGTVSVPVVIGSVFQFTQRTQDNRFGSATTTIDQFTAPKLVPAPTPGVMLFPLLTALAVLRRRYRRQSLR